MIQIIDKKDCCGCNACVQKCPKRCIAMEEDYEGFLYPKVNKALCINCGLCEKVCPIINKGKSCSPKRTYAIKNRDEEIRRQSSSGGFFTFIAENIIKDGGVVFGARFDDNWEVVHDYTETLEGLSFFRGSKYVQSRIEDNFKKVEFFLKQGRKVLFSGTPCQVAGLKLFLCKEYDNLLTVDFVCHGIPSPGVWRRYLKEKVMKVCDKKKNVRIEDLSFRNKKTGWKNYSFSMKLVEATNDGIIYVKYFSELSRNNIFMKGFLADLYLRPCCYTCPAKCGKSGSDITIGDLWGAPSIIGEDDDDRGTSLVLINKDIPHFINNSFIWTKEINYSTALVHNPAIEHSAEIPLRRTSFYESIVGVESLENIVYRLTKTPLWKRILHLIKRTIKVLFKV